ncbi:unnamed protein product [Rhizoctonia solani]|uniref:Endoplasmic reticulum junction formation protein lunapark n=3 Tax=Rhizoctonia solani TaxID=456999 RepID=A0A8H2X5I4_9AGAM|nr:lunapark protein [Rhizoctonia solani AG-3 Rhs1AP]KEP54152.1 lunapark protein [Rhizoctonia solani 123E]CAE6417779.1 unnamed protein product [Rhizoctonia solani]
MGSLSSRLVHLCDSLAGRPPNTMELANSQIGRQSNTSYPSGPGSTIIRRFVKSWYKRREALEEVELKKLRAEQKKKVEEIKAKYNFDKIRALVEPQAESPRREDPNSNLRQRAITMNPSAPRTSTRQLNQQRAAPFDPRAPPMLQVPASMPPQSVLSPQRGWLDKVADKVLGEEMSPLGIAQSRYALICERCFSHNGLVKENDWETAQYICPKCGHMNLSPRTRRSGIPATPYLTVPPTPIAGVLSRASPSPTPVSSEPPSQDHPSQDQPGPNDIKMEIDPPSS